MTENRISLSVSDDKKARIAALVAQLVAEVKDLYTQMSKEEIKSLAKMGDGRIPFVEKVAVHAAANSQFVPPFGDVPEFQIDLQAFKDGREIVSPLRQIVNNLENTTMISGSEAWDFARNFYKSIQYHAKMGVPDAQTIYDDLRPLFENRTVAATSPEKQKT